MHKITAYGTVVSVGARAYDGRHSATIEPTSGGKDCPVGSLEVYIDAASARIFGAALSRPNEVRITIELKGCLCAGPPPSCSCPCWCHGGPDSGWLDADGKERR